MAMVKPTPPKMLAPSIWNQFTFSGSEASLLLTIAKLISMMPSGLTTNRPSMTPYSTGSVSMEPMSIPVKLTSALVKANKGRMPKYTHGYSLCSRRVAGGTTWRVTWLRSATVLM